MLKLINKLMTKSYFPIALKYFTLLAYIFLIVIGFTANSDNPAFLKILRNTNLANLIVWSYWWPAIIILAIFFGRFWCMMCPVELITSFFAKIGLKKKRPKWLLSGWGITIFYFIILFVGINILAVHRNPTFMSIYLLTIVGISVIIGFIYEKNTFCRYICPVGYLLGLYSKLSFLGLRVKDKNLCDTCKDKSCIHKSHIYNLNYKSCGVDLYPAKIDDNSHCILCGGCMKTCNTYNPHQIVGRPNPALTRIGFAYDLLKTKTLKMPEVAFIFIVSGFVISEIWEEWKVTEHILEYLPTLLIKHISISNVLLSTILREIVLFIVVPLILWLLPYFIAKIFGLSLKLKEYLLNYGLAFLPIVAAAHLDKAILKTTSRIPYFEYVFSDVTGKTTARQIYEGKVVLAKNPWWLHTAVSILITIITIGGIWLGFMVVKRINHKLQNTSSNKIMYILPIVYGSIFFTMIISWRWLSLLF